MSENRHRPIGVWVFLFLNILVVMPWAVPWLFPNLQEGYHPTSPYILALALSSILSTFGAWTGNRYSRITMLALLTLVQLLLMFAAVALIADVAPPSELLFTIAVIVTLGAVWLGANYWYFLGARTRAFYSRGEST